MGVQSRFVAGALAAMMCIGSASVLAEDAKPANPSASKTPGSGPNPYRDCGIGAALFPETHWAAITSNVIWDVGTTALTSATSSPQTCNGKSVAVAQFIVDTYTSVAEETARGSGHHLTAMLEIYGCDAASHGDIIAAVRPQVGAQVAEPTHAGLSHIEKSEQYYLILDEQVRTQFAASCAV